MFETFIEKWCSLRNATMEIQGDNVIIDEDIILSLKELKMMGIKDALNKLDSVWMKKGQELILKDVFPVLFNRKSLVNEENIFKKDIDKNVACCFCIIEGRDDGEKIIFLDKNKFTNIPEDYLLQAFSNNEYKRTGLYETVNIDGTLIKVITNELESFGAINMFNPRLLDEIAEDYNSSEIKVKAIDSHFAMAYTDASDEILELLQEDLQNEKFLLSDDIYVYNSVIRKIKLLED